ncbi:SoxR reducing system RseC family protein [Thermotalea metallivorans]|uniref:SoxR reducing system protein RseC n=1 Tax=Thermotalea metallivorans TaxID=520762 RepID=A0A140L0J5_9FIRM|nr:SoxR reducing system RseC family protein [Thermotalea metallivorans]KXG74070.1 hypothetical protein AN619_26800 [Thermotalea metallivorans]
MNQTGKVIEVVKNNKARVLMTKHSACGDCGACQHGKENMQLSIVAMNEVGAKAGDWVEVNMETQNVMGAAFIVYVIPLMAMLLGIGTGSFLLKNMHIEENLEAYSAGIGFILMACTFFIVKVFEKRFHQDKRYIPTITKILNRSS